MYRVMVKLLRCSGRHSTLSLMASNGKTPDRHRRGHFCGDTIRRAVIRAVGPARRIVYPQE